MEDGDDTRLQGRSWAEDTLQPVGRRAAAAGGRNRRRLPRMEAKEEDQKKGYRVIKGGKDVHEAEEKRICALYPPPTTHIVDDLAL